MIINAHNSKPAGRTHIYLLLDRSGSMEAIRDDVIGGFNAFIDDQRRHGDDARVTLVQFDTQAPADVVVDGVGLARVPTLTRDRFVPRGGTPLFDATGLIIARAQEHEAARRTRGKSPEQVVVVTITDGRENSSREFTRHQVLDLVKAREADGWTFVFLSSALDAYDEASGIGYDPRSTQTFTQDSLGAQVAFASLSQATVRLRDTARLGQQVDNLDFFHDDKPAEAPPTKRLRWRSGR